MLYVTINAAIPYILADSHRNIRSMLKKCDAKFRNIVPRDVNVILLEIIILHTDFVGDFLFMPKLSSLTKETCFLQCEI
jgi:hypothetical protein